MKNFLQKILTLFEKKAKTLNRVEIIEKNLVENYNLIENISGRKIFPAIKANAYGHGLEQCVKILHKKNPKYFAVDSYYEALQVQKFCTTPVLIMGANPLENIPAIIAKKFTLTVFTLPTLQAIIESKQSAKIHIMCNTGMNREGCTEQDIEKIIDLLKKNPRIECEGIFSHFADADGETKEYTELQEKKFSRMVDQLEAAKIFPQWIHLGNSAGCIQTNDKRINACRSGLALYGMNPLPTEKKFSRLQPILRFIATVTDIQHLQKGDKVSYNGTYTAKKDMKSALISLGYYDALDRKLSNCGYVKYKKKFLPIIGRVCMNYIMVDTRGENIQIGDEVIAISEIPVDKNSADNIAQLTDTISYETLTRVSSSVRRVII